MKINAPQRRVVRGNAVSVAVFVAAASMMAACGTQKAGMADATVGATPPSVSSAPPPPGRGTSNLLSASASGSDSSVPDSTSPSSSSSPSLPPSAQLVTLTTPLAAPDSGIRLDPVPAGDEPHVGPAVAYDAFSKEEPFDFTGDASTVELAVYTNTLNPGIPTPQVSSSLWDKSELVWVIQYSHIDAVWALDVPGGSYYHPSPSPGASSVQPSPLPTDCAFVFLASAQTGNYISAQGTCPAEMTPVPTAESSVPSQVRVPAKTSRARH